MKVALLLCVLLPAVLCVTHVDIPDTAGCPVSAGEVTTDGRVFLVSDQTHCLGAGVDISTLHFVAWSEWEMSRVGIAIGPSEIVSFGGAYNKTLDTLFVCHKETFKEDIVLFVPDFTVRDCIWLAKSGYSTFACVGFSHTENLDGWLIFNGVVDHASCDYFTPGANYTFHPFMAEIGTQWWLPHNAWFDGDELHVAVVSEITNDIHVAVFDFGVPPHDDPALLYVRLLDENIYEVSSAMVASYHSRPYLFVGCDYGMPDGRTVPAVVFADLTNGASQSLNLHLPVDQGEVAGIWLKENQLAVLQKDAGIITKYDMSAQPTVSGYAELPHPRNNVALDLFETENYFLVPRREWRGMSVEIVHMELDFCDKKCGANAICSESKCECVPGYEKVEDTFECVSSAELHKPECSYVDGCHYDGLDLSALIGKGPGYEGRWKAVESTDVAQTTYWFNLCHSVTFANSNSTCDVNTAVCSQVYDHGQQYNCVGRFDTIKWRDHAEGPEKGAIVTFSGGSTGHSTEITYVCDETVPDLRVGAAKTGADKVTKFAARTKLACGRQRKPDPKPEPKPEPEPAGMPSWLVAVLALGSVGMVSTAAVCMFFISRRYPRRGMADNKTEMTTTLITKE